MTQKKAGVRLAKRIILGKNKPPFILRILCWFTFIWNSILILFALLLGVYSFIDSKYLQSNASTEDFTPKFCFSYATLLGLSLLGAILMYRLNKSGLYLYCLANILMVILPFILLNNIPFSGVHVAFTAIPIALFLTQIKKLN